MVLGIFDGNDELLLLGHGWTSGVGDLTQLFVAGDQGLGELGFGVNHQISCGRIGQAGGKTTRLP
jgi:hypothetical protein